MTASTPSDPSPRAVDADRTDDTCEPALPVGAGLVAGLVTAALFALAWPPFGAWPLVLVAPAPLAWWAARASRARVAFAVGFLTQFPAWVVLEWWILELTAPGFVALCCLCSSYGGLFAVVFRRVSRSRRFGRWPAAVTLPIVWCAIEYLRTSIVLGGYPWFQLGIPLVGGPTSAGILGQSASLVGSHGLSAVAAVMAGALVDLARWRTRPRRTAFAGAAIALVVLAANAAYGAWLVSTARTRRLDGPRLLVLQTNVPVSNKTAWSREDQVRDFGEFLEATAAACAAAAREGRPPDVVLWPETMVPGVGLEPQAVEYCETNGLYPGDMYARALVDLHRHVGAPLLVGSGAYLGLRVMDDRFVWDKHFNSAYLIAGDPPHERYDKLLLTPFGEEMPLISRSDWLEAKLLAIGAPGMAFNLDAGASPVRFTVPFRTDDGTATARVATPICFEDTVGSVCRALAYEDGTKVADLLVNPTNDGWFGGSQGGREQHVLHARLRSIELAVPMVRCANTGLSVAIDDLGAVVDWIGRPEGDAAPGRGTIRGTLLTSVELSNRTTVFGRIGDLWSMLLLGLGTIMALLASPRLASEHSTGR